MGKHEKIGPFILVKNNGGRTHGKYLEWPFEKHLFQIIFPMFFLFGNHIVKVILIWEIILYIFKIILYFKNINNYFGYAALLLFFLTFAIHLLFSNKKPNQKDIWLMLWSYCPFLSILIFLSFLSFFVPTILVLTCRKTICTNGRWHGLGENSHNFVW